MIIFHDSASAEYARPGHPERPARVTRTAAHLRQHHPEWKWQTPAPASDEALLRAHDRALVESVRQPNGDFDADTPAYPEIFAHASRAAGSALRAMETALAGERAFSLMRPPGH